MITVVIRFKPIVVKINPLETPRIAAFLQSSHKSVQLPIIEQLADGENPPEILDWSIIND